MPAVGLTFSPINAPQGQGSAGQSPLQDAIKLLSFKLPTVVGAGTGSGFLGPPTLAGGLGPSDGGMNQFLMQLLKGIVPDAGGPADAPVMGQPPRPAVQFPQATPPQLPPMGGAPDMPNIPRPDLQFPEGFRFG